MNAATDSLSYPMLTASNFSADELSEIYNLTRTDYMVPMPMDPRRMQTYIRTYDIDLDLSAVILNEADEPVGLGMLGVRDDRAWITRLGIQPEERRAGMGAQLMAVLLQGARSRCAEWVQLEVIEGNTPAHALFKRYGFVENRGLAIICRPPGAPEMAPPTPGATIQELTESDIWKCLATRGPGASWVNENASLVKIENLQGLEVRLPSGYRGWIVFQRTTFEITHVVYYAPPIVRDEMLLNLLFALHSVFPDWDTKIENVSLLDLRGEAFPRLDYVEMFRRIEMFLQL